MMADDFHASQATEQLDRVLGFFDRAESKASVLFAVDTGMLALIALNLRSGDFQDWFLVLLGTLTVVFLGGSFFFLYRCAVPNLSGGNGSLVYFREIAKRTENRFIEDFLAQTKDERARDVLGQVWRNSEILNLKFNSVKWAFSLTAAALVPWCSFLAIVSVVHAQLSLG
jgi:hypothetical protein